MSRVEHRCRYSGDDEDRGRPQRPGPGGSPANVKWEYLHPIDQIAAPQAARIAQQPVRPLEAEPLNSSGRPLLLASYEFQAGADAKSDTARAIDRGDLLRDQFLLG